MTSSSSEGGLLRRGEAVSASSEARRRLARELIATCPPSLGSEIALTGSAARGVADDYSDIELNFWCDEIPPRLDRVDWLRTSGATDITMDFDAVPDGTVWSILLLEGVWVEAGWQTVEKLERSLDTTLSGTSTDHDLLLVPWMLGEAFALRTKGRLDAWRQAATRYPEGLSEHLIESAASEWVWPPWVASRWALVDRGESLALAHALAADARSALRVLYAVNHEWEPDWKWARAETPRLAMRPDRLAERLDVVFGGAEPRERVATCLRLVLDVLALAPPSESIRRAREVVAASLAERPESDE